MIFVREDTENSMRTGGLCASLASWISFGPGAEFATVDGQSWVQNATLALLMDSYFGVRIAKEDGVRFPRYVSRAVSVEYQKFAESAKEDTRNFLCPGSALLA